MDEKREDPLPPRLPRSNPLSHNFYNNMSSPESRVHLAREVAHGQAPKPERKAEQGPVRGLLHPEVMTALERLVDLEREQRALTASMAVETKQEKGGIGAELQRRAPAERWKTLEAQLHQAAYEVSQALGLGDRIGQPMSEQIPAPPIPPIEKIPPPPIPKRPAKRHIVHAPIQQPPRDRRSAWDEQGRAAA